MSTHGKEESSWQELGGDFALEYVHPEVPLPAQVTPQQRFTGGKYGSNMLLGCQAKSGKSGTALLRRYRKSQGTTTGTWSTPLRAGPSLPCSAGSLLPKTCRFFAT
jgi:hypothetical protein